jgi:ABC-2 type transport system permease protein
MMLRGLWKLTWLELKIFLREPLGAIGAIGIPVLMFVLVGGIVGGGNPSPEDLRFVRNGLPVLVALLIAIGAVSSLVAIISIYREGGILKRLRATPLRPPTILTAHVLVKLLLTAVTIVVMMLAGRRYYPVEVDFPFVSFTLALLISTCSILSIGFVIASIVPTARFAQPLSAVLLYPMVAISGLFVPLSELPSALQSVARLLPLTYVVSLLTGILNGAAWSAHAGDVGALVLFMILGIAISSRVFRWE